MCNSPDVSETQRTNTGDPDPISIILEIANLAFQPGSLALIAELASATGTVATAIITYRELSERKKSEIRRALYEIDRALTKGFAGLMTLASLLDEFNFVGRKRQIGGAPIRGFKKVETLRRTHEDCRAAVKEARDAFIDLSALLPAEHAAVIDKTIQRLNELSEPILNVGQSYGVFLAAAALALQEDDTRICAVGEGYKFQRSPRDFAGQLMRSIPGLPDIKARR